jgi:hypothetical protein
MALSEQVENDNKYLSDKITFLYKCSHFTYILYHVTVSCSSVCRNSQRAYSKVFSCSGMSYGVGDRIFVSLLN